MKKWGANQLKFGFYSLGQVILDLILPPKCLNCDCRVDQAHNICPDCWKKLHFISDPKCRCCGYPFEPDLSLNYHALGESLCGQCQVLSRSFERAASALRYDDESRKMIIGFKHNDRLEYLDYFVKLLRQAGADIFPGVDYIVPVPLHKKRLLHRRYNQSALLSRALSKKLDVDHAPEFLVRTKNTPPQEGNLNKRAVNVRGAFKVGPHYQKLARGKKILLIDDVYTTGATVENCAKAIKKAGAAEVYVLTVFRVISPQNPN